MIKRSNVVQYRAGFFMTEFLLYLALSACVALFIMRYIYGTTVRLRATTAQTDRIASIYAALDSIAHDLEQAPGTVADWRTLNQEELSWQQGNTILGWKLDAGTLKRQAKNYHTKEQRWKRPVTHVALEDVQAVQFTPHYEQKNMHAITVALTGRLAGGKTYQCKRSVPLQGKVIV